MQKVTNAFDFRKSLIEYGFKDNLVDDCQSTKRLRKQTHRRHLIHL
jgi:hypothetical protein